MPMQLADLQKLVIDLVRDDTDRFAAPGVDTALGRALTRYSADRPRPVVADLTVAAGGHLVDLPEDWEDGFSGLTGVEHPVGEVPPRRLAADAFGLYRLPSGIKILLIDALAPGATVRVGYTLRHVLDSDTNTIADEHAEAVAKWAAALLCDQLAAFYANETDSTIQADSVRQQTKAQAYRASARDYRKAYSDQVGVADRASVPAGAVVTLKSTDSLGGPRLFHPPGRRLR